MKPVDYIAPVIVIASSVGVGLRPTWVSVGAFMVAVVFLAAERLWAAWTARKDAEWESTRAMAIYVAEIKGLREEVKHVRDAASKAISATTLNRGIF